ncbi:MAG: methylated-DNA--[protein]-cysteine S-methyltransferase [Limnothrix sp. RL_2_0]|nr:methylated-DNA--[protein]-cysteine S-methyltransferase [Limnothrix sp. RL_2_0]
MLYGYYDSPFGLCLIATTKNKLCNLYFLDASDKTAGLDLLRSEWPDADIAETSAITTLGDRLFNGTPPDPSTFSLHLQGTDFQTQVWQALLNIPFGQTVTYQELAQSIGRPTAARAVGNAVGRNPISFLIPCHRVIRSSGKLGGYRWGFPCKTALLNWEQNYSQNG